MQHFSVPSFSPKLERNVPLGECKMLAPCRGDLEVLEVMVSSTKLRRALIDDGVQVVLSGVGRDALEACELTLKRLHSRRAELLRAAALVGSGVLISTGRGRGVA